MVKVCEELNDRYDGEAQQLANLIVNVDHYKMMRSVELMLEDGCFCPSCMLFYLESE